MGIKSLIAKLAIKSTGWRAQNNIGEIPEKCILCAAPHTSNWDFIIAKLCYTTVCKQKPNFLIKKEWMKFPMNLILKPLGAIGVDRGKKTSLTESVIAEMNLRKKFQLAITPEGTRSKNPNWKRGFWTIAKKCNVPIVIMAIDYKTKTMILDHIENLSDNIQSDIQNIKQWYSDNNIVGKHPENFAI